MSLFLMKPIIAGQMHKNISAVANAYPLVQHFAGTQVHHTESERQTSCPRVAYVPEGFSELRWLGHKEEGENQGWPQISGQM